VHDVADGGLALALAEAAVAGGVGAAISGIGSVDQFFGESPSRVVAVVAAGQIDAIRRRADAAGVPVRAIGRVGGDRLVIDGLVDVSVAALTRKWRDHLPVAFGEASTP
jgi:phosphoribosylformylglycinamidine (FGAM) synthase-like enzyme